MKPNRQLDERLHPVQVQIFAKMSPQERLRLCGELSRATWNRAKDGFRRAFPECTEAQVHKKFIASLYGQQLADKVYPE